MGLSANCGEYCALGEGSWSRSPTDGRSHGGGTLECQFTLRRCPKFASSSKQPDSGYTRLTESHDCLSPSIGGPTPRFGSGLSSKSSTWRIGPSAPRRLLAVSSSPAIRRSGILVLPHSAFRVFFRSSSHSLRSR